MSKTKTVTKTEEIEIKMVECSSCGQDIEKKEAHYFMIRDTKNKHDCISQTNGWACEYCVETQISLPVIYRTLGDNTGWLELAAAVMITILVLSMVIQILVDVLLSII